MIPKEYYLTEKQMNYAFDMKNVQKGTLWDGRCDNATINNRIAHTISVRGAGGQQRAGVSNFVCKQLPMDFSVKDFKKLMGNT